MTSLLSRLAVGGVLIAALGGAVAPVAVAAPAPAAVNCNDGNVLKQVLVSADHDGVGVAFNFACKVSSIVDIAPLNPGEKPYNIAGEGEFPKLDKTAKSWVRVMVSGIDWTNPSAPNLGTYIKGEGAVKQIVNGGTFEGQTLWFIGLDKKRPFVKNVSGKTVTVTVKAGA
ncbi:hypothetical protein [Allokutzneria oryzae]|uniref:Secreted protein n=1 Tax=Allokutzneria oryzae TaxID=1378989 RepID=A0ABV5ZZG1_9PSEU